MVSIWAVNHATVNTTSIVSEGHKLFWNDLNYSTSEFEIVKRLNLSTLLD
jgi:hypothetical protein